MERCFTPRELVNTSSRLEWNAAKDIGASSGEDSCFFLLPVDADLASVL